MNSQIVKDIFPSGFDFLDLVENAAEKSSTEADHFIRGSGEKLPASAERLGSVLSLLYRAACCNWGCRGDDHQAEWLTGRVVNQALSSFRLIRAGYYDESFMLTRGIGEIANLFWLFDAVPSEFPAWRASSRKERVRSFGPYAVREKLKRTELNGSPIDDDRYQRLCEISTHPIPGLAPGHYSGLGRPVLGVILQPAGVFVSVTELSFAVAMCAIPCAKLLGLEDERQHEINKEAIALVRSLGAFNIMNYDELLSKALSNRHRLEAVH